MARPLEPAIQQQTASAELGVPKEIPVFKPLIEQGEIDAAVAALELGWLGMGSYVHQFERQIEQVCGLSENSDRHAVAVSTGHAALHLALLMMEVGPGDEVITPSFNNAADFQAIRACGADPVFVDILPETLCIDPNKIEPLITAKTKCIIAMDYDICVCDHQAIADIAKRYEIQVLHDAAHSFGSYYESVPVGNQHDYTMFSFDPVKTITCIDGGALIVRGTERVERLHAKRLIGMTQPASRMYENARAWTYDLEELGFRYHMANLHAAIGLSQIAKLDDIRRSRQEACSRYREELAGLSWLHAPGFDFSSVNPFLYYVRVLDGRRDAFREHLKQAGVDTGIHWQPGHLFSFLKDCRRGELSVTERISSEIVSLPLHSKMSSEDVTHIIEAVRSFSH